MSNLPALYYKTTDLPEDQAFEMWRQLMAPMYHVAPVTPASALPRGDISCYLVQDIIANRTRFTPQHVIRDRRRVDRTPDHLVVQFWRTGGSRGEMAGKPSNLAPGHVALADRRRTIEARIDSSDTYGFVIPRYRLEGIDLGRNGLSLDRDRNRLLAARVRTLFHQLPNAPAESAAALAESLIAFLRRLLDPSAASDVLEGTEFDDGLFGMAEAAIRLEIGQKLTPQILSEKLGVSRATLYRAFEPIGGVMQHLQELRLLTIQAALSDPLETRSLTRLAAEHGFSSLAYFSRAFRARFGVSAKDWRAQQIAKVSRDRQQTVDRAKVARWWSSARA